MFYRFVETPGREATQCLVLFAALQDIEAQFGPIWERLLGALVQWKPQAEWRVLLIDIGAVELRQFYSLTQEIDAEQAAVSCLNELWRQPEFWRPSFYFAQLSLEPVPVTLQASNLSYSQQGWQVTDLGSVETSVLQNQFSQEHSLANWEFWTHPICNLYYRRGIEPPLPVGDPAFDLYGLAKVSSLALQQWLNDARYNPGVVQRTQQSLAQYYQQLPPAMQQDCLEQGQAYAEKLQAYAEKLQASAEKLPSSSAQPWPYQSLWQQQAALALSPQDLRQVFIAEAFCPRRQWQKLGALSWAERAKKYLKYSLPYGLVRAVQNHKKG